MILFENTLMGMQVKDVHKPLLNAWFKNISPLPTTKYFPIGIGTAIVKERLEWPDLSKRYISKYPDVTRLNRYLYYINWLCSFYNIKRLYTFGSILTEKFNQESDIDFFAEFYRPDSKTDYKEALINLRFDLVDIFHRPIDIFCIDDVRRPQPVIRRFCESGDQAQLTWNHNTDPLLQNIITTRKLIFDPEISKLIEAGEYVDVKDVSYQQDRLSSVVDRGNY